MPAQKIMFDPNKTLDDVKREHITAMLEHLQGNKMQAAAKLGVTSKTLYNQMHKYGLFEKYRKNVSRWYHPAVEGRIDSNEDPTLVSGQ